MKIKNFKINWPLFVGIVLAVTLVSCHNDKIKREGEVRENIRTYFDDVPRIQVEEILESTNNEYEETSIDNIKKAK